MISDKEFEETKARAKRYANEIRIYLDTKDLNPDLETCLEFTLEDLTKEKATHDELVRACTAYEVIYKPAVEASSEFIKSESNGYSKV